ncbi:glycosyltransferase family 4 protein [Candidatus Poribacteria bacterium]|nr:glycosyltransferase family 4 protein [Candidatus Poribacteria bacterium]
MRILYIIDSMTKDGAESQLLKTLARLPPEQYEVSVVLSRAEGERVAELAALPCVREVTTLTARNKRRHLLEKAFAMAGIVSALKPDIVHSWLWYSNFLCGLSRKCGFWRRIPFVASQRGDYHARYGKFRLWLTEKVIYNTADVLLTNSEPIQRYLCQRYPAKQIHSIPNLLELPTEVWARRKPTPETEEKLIVSVGRFAPEKGHSYLIEALNLLKRQNIAWRCTFLGEGELAAELRALVEKYGLSAQVTFPGFCEDVFSVLLTADVFVLPSLHESSPNALIEAMGIGMPCIASDVGGIVDLVEDEANGVRVPPKDPTSLAAALQRVLTEPDFAQKLGKNARTTIQRKFDTTESMQKLEDVYRLLYDGDRLDRKPVFDNGKNGAETQ